MDSCFSGIARNRDWGIVPLGANFTFGGCSSPESASSLSLALKPVPAPAIRPFSEGTVYGERLRTIGADGLAGGSKANALWEWNIR